MNKKIILSLLISSVSLGLFSKKRFDDEFDEGTIMGLIFSGVLPIVVSIIVFATNSTEIITGFINPDYGAIRDIAVLFKN